MLDNLSNKRDIIKFARRLYLKNLTTSMGGNISVRLDNNQVLLTPSAIDKNNIKIKQIAKLNLDGENLKKKIKPSIEKNMHLAIYNKRKDVHAIIHAHPAIASAFTAMENTINTNLLAEARVFLGNPVKIPYIRQGTNELADAVGEAFLKCNVAILQNHGVITAGKNLIEAFERVEVLESAAKITLITFLMKNKIEINEGEFKYLDSII